MTRPEIRAHVAGKLRELAGEPGDFCGGQRIAYSDVLLRTTPRLNQVLPANEELVGRGIGVVGIGAESWKVSGAVLAEGGDSKVLLTPVGQTAGARGVYDDRVVSREWLEDGVRNGALFLI